MNWDDLFLLMALVGLAVTILITDKSLSKQPEEVQSFNRESIQAMPKKRKLIYHKIIGKTGNSGNISKKQKADAEKLTSRQNQNF